MPDGPRRHPARAWLALAVVLGAGSLLPMAWPALAQTLVWRSGLAWTEPWRWWGAAWVHGSVAHAALNGAGLALLAALGWMLRLPARAALAWALAWPLTQLGWLLGPPLASYFGLSGVLHAGLVVLGLTLVREGHAPALRARTLGWALLLGLALKLALEDPFGPTLHAVPALGIAVAPWSHFSGSMAGLCCAGVVRAALSVKNRLRR